MRERRATGKALGSAVVAFLLAQRTGLPLAQLTTPLASHTPSLGSTLVVGAASRPSSGIFGAVSVSGGSFPGRRASASGPCVRILRTDGVPAARGICDDEGHFRVRLAPGNYIVSAGGRHRLVEIKPGLWTPIDFSLVAPRSR